MYISNSTTGMAAILPQNKNCMKTLTNGGSNIIVGNVVGAATPTTHIGGNTTLGGVATQITSAASATLGGNIVLQQQQPTILLTNGATSSVISYQQYQQLLAQQQQVQHQQQQVVSVPLGSIVTTGNGGLTVISGNNSNASTTHGAFIVATSTAPTVTANHNPTVNVSSFQQQFQQQIKQEQQQQQQQHLQLQQQNNVIATTNLNNILQRQQVPTSRPANVVFAQNAVSTAAPVSISNATGTRYFAQFAPQTANNNTANNNNNNNRTTHLLINRNNNTIIAGNTTQRLQHATILNKPPVQRVINTATLQSIKQQQVILKQQPQPQQVSLAVKRNAKPIVPAVSAVKLVSVAAGATAASPATTADTPTVATTNTPATPITALTNGRVITSVPVSAINHDNVIRRNSVISNSSVAPVTYANQNSSTLTYTKSIGSTTATTGPTPIPRSVAAPPSASASASAPVLASAPATAPAPTPISTSVDSAAANIKREDIKPGQENTDTAAQTSAEQEEPEVDIVINNVVCSFSVRCHLNLREIALRGCNVEYRRENGMVTMKLRNPYTTASIWSSGRITCTGATSEIQANVAARRYARCLEKLGFRVRFSNFRVVNVLGTCSMPWAIKIVNFSEKHKKDANYEPELHPGVTYKLRNPKATLKIFSTGSITVTAASVANVQAAIEHIYPLVHEFRKKRSPEEQEQLRLKQMNQRSLEIPDNKPLESRVSNMKEAKKRVSQPPISDIDVLASKKFILESGIAIDKCGKNPIKRSPSEECLVLSTFDDLIEGPEDEEYEDDEEDDENEDDDVDEDINF
ncbi:putative GPI-anchored protein pfl2 [Teleopsis dalmanni]|uniref:putative GPI-anchored protein pfl2 n=1 Tax=Teleopsis dalmanni TaxID=139649 RepID=UPI0018CE89D5|nr:putative GPI-anchored protein pfl2 [Teleopsis dalmanni]